jgi:hypothetical protein
MFVCLSDNEPRKKFTLYLVFTLKNASMCGKMSVKEKTTLKPGKAQQAYIAD